MSSHWVKDSCLGSSRANKLWSRLSEMAHTFHPNTWGQSKGHLGEFKDNEVYVDTLRPARAT